MPDTFLVIFPLTQVIVNAFGAAIGAADALGDGVATGAAGSWVNLTLTVGAE